MTREEAITTLKEMHESFDEIHENTNGDIGYEQMTAIDMAIEALSADTVEVVRCKDCKNRAKYAECDFLGEDGFCPHGERREESEAEE